MNPTVFAALAALLVAGGTVFWVKNRKEEEDQDAATSAEPTTELVSPLDSAVAARPDSERASADAVGELETGLTKPLDRPEGGASGPEEVVPAEEERLPSDALETDPWSEVSERAVPASVLSESEAEFDSIAAEESEVAAADESTTPEHAVERYDEKVDAAASDRLAAIAAIGRGVKGRPANHEVLEAVAVLGQLSLDLDAVVRQAAVAAIGRIPCAEVIPYLERALRDPDLDVVAAASEAMARYKFYPPAEAIAPPLPDNAAAIDEPDALDADEFIIVPPATLQAARSVPASGATLEYIDPERQERLEAIAALGEVTDGRPVNAERQQAVELLAQLSLDPDAAVRVAAVGTLGQVPDPQVVPYLERALRDSDSDVIAAASTAIARYKFYPVVEIDEVPLPSNGVAEVED